MSKCTITVDPTITDRRELRDDESGTPEIIMDICAANDTARGKTKCATLEYIAGVIVTRGKRRRLEPIAHTLRDKISTSAQSAAYWRPLTSIRSADKAIAAAKLAAALTSFGDCGFKLGKVASDLLDEGNTRLNEAMAAEAEKRAEARAAAAEKKAQAAAIEQARAKESPDNAAARAALLASITDLVRQAIAAGATQAEIAGAVKAAAAE